MDFSRIDLTDMQRALAAEATAVFRDLVTEDVLAQERETGDGFNETVHRELGARGWLVPHWPVEQGGAGFGDVEQRIIELARINARTPWITANTTRMAWVAVEQHARPDVRDELRPGVADGSVRFALGYTEPHGGSDIADVRTRAERDGDGWRINGSKVFITGIQQATHLFLLARTGTGRAGLTMFLVPLPADGVEAYPIRTYGDERTNSVFLDNVQVDDRWRLGEVGAGWTVLSGPLQEEHTRTSTSSLGDPSIGTRYARTLGRALDAALLYVREARHPDGSALSEDPVVLDALGRVATMLQAAVLAGGPSGRILGAEMTVQGVGLLIDVIGLPALVAHGQSEAISDGVLEAAYRQAQGMSVYGGTTDVFRAMIATELGLPRPRYPDRISPTITA